MRVRAAILVVLLALTACSAEDQTARKREALAEAQAELAARTDAFCTASATYVTALDRYGDLITETAPTVGDVKEAGADLGEPRSEVVEAAEDVASAREEVAKAEKELAFTEPPPSREPLVAATTVNRVKQADADFTAAQEGIADQTPLQEASERFNAAAVALEMSWLALLAEGGCLSEDQLRQARDYTLAVQKSLAEAGYYKREVDGVYGPDTVAAVQALQRKNGLAETGTVDKATDAALQAELRAKGGAAADEAIASTAAVQQTLKLAGFWTGPVDGQWTDALTEALKEFQAELGVKPTGTVDAATIAALEKALEETSGPSPAARTPVSSGSS
ncbi:peptidoglycan-binding domain-containing protein [Actinoplanes sp. NPDC051861]|uniref:peptidoglycan-binding domain-containing protein n=1 Tax=Actinoplanes sp. NPDC051861 TaxID=3155170 RepID=UPI003418735E